MILFYIIGAGWLVFMLFYILLRNKINTNRKEYYDLSNRVIRNKKYKDRLNQSSKSIFK